MDEIIEAVELTDEQAEEIRPLLAEEYEKRMELYTAAGDSASGHDEQSLMQEIEGLEEKTDLKVAVILDEEQLEKWEAWRDEESAQRRDETGRR